MAFNPPNLFTCNIKEFIIDEIALEGLEGIGVKLLWKRLEVRMNVPITEKMKSRYWNYIVKCKDISIYSTREPTRDIEIIDRRTVIDPESGYHRDPDDYLDGPYEYNPVDAHGSCANYHKRVLITDEIKELSYDKVLSEYGEYFTMVASIEERWKALAPDLPISLKNQFIPLHYCMLELIGRSRQNGQMTIGMTNLTQIVKDSKILFYHRKVLQDLDLVRVTQITQLSSGKAVKGLLIRLKRFHSNEILSVPTTGLIHNLVEYLKSQPNYCEKTDVIIKKGLMTQAQNKKFQKKVSIFHFEENPVTSDLIYTPPTPQDTESAKKHIIRKRYMCLVSKSDESSQSEDEEAAPPLKCQYKVGVNILRQAYERFLDAGRKGLTQNELAQLLGIEFYACRTICRIFKAKNIIREFMECKGRQRLGRYIAIAATSKMDSKLAEEKEKFKKLLDEGNKLCKKIKRSPSEVSSDSESLIVKKKRKLDNNDIIIPESSIMEVKFIDGVRRPVEKKLNLKSKVSLRQLKLVNGILKVLHEKMIVVGYQTLSNLVAADSNEPPIDTKALKLLLQGMVSGGNVKIYKIKLPRSQFQYTVVICAPNIKPNHQLLRDKYKDLVQRVNTSKKVAQNKMTYDNRPLSQYAYPRYVKVQKLHEAIVKIVYFNDVKSEHSDIPPGFFSLKSLIPQLTVGVALGHISSEGVLDVSRFTIDDSLLEVKICDAPSNVNKALTRSKNLQSSLRSILRILAHFGLVQHVVQPSNDANEVPDNCMAINLFYVNKHAKIIDTTGVWPREEESIESLEKEFHFESMAVVKEYWTSVYQISINTTIDVPNRRQKYFQFKPPARTINQALELDNGQRYGNDKGPCGFDSLYYLDVQRLWKAYCIRSSSLKSKLQKSPVKIPKFDIPKKPKVQKRKLKPSKKVVNKVKKCEIVETIKQGLVKIGDKNKKRKTHISKWTPEEDRLLMMCKTAITIMSPISQPGSLRVRNLVAKDILSIKDPKKTQGLCHKRISLVDTNPTLIHEKNCILNELRRRNLVEKYEGLLKKLRILYSTNMTKYINEARVPMMELVWIIFHISKSMPWLREIPREAMTLEEFHKNFTIASSGSNQLGSLYRTPHDSKVKIATLKEAIFLTVMLSYNNNVNTKTANIIYSYFQKFSEADLRSAIEPLRKCGAIAAKDKVIRTQMQIIDFDDIVQCSYRISAVYQRKWINRLNSQFGDKLGDFFKGALNNDAIKATAESNCFCFEQQTNGMLETIAVTVPVITGPTGSIIQEDQMNIIDLLTNFKLKSGTLGWKHTGNLTSYSDLYKDLIINEAFHQLTRKSFISRAVYQNQNNDANHNIVSYLKTKREKGATLKELQDTLNYDWNTLNDQLTELQDLKIIKRVGFYENAVVLMKYVKHWCMNIPSGLIIPVPWLTLEGTVRPDIFIRWAGVMMNKIFECPGSSMAYLSETYELISTRATQDVCEVLQKWECATLHTINYKMPSLFSEDDDDSPELVAYSEFESPKNIVAFPVKDSMSKFAFIKSSMLFKGDKMSCVLEDPQ